MLIVLYVHQVINKSTIVIMKSAFKWIGLHWEKDGLRASWTCYILTSIFVTLMYFQIVTLLTASKDLESFLDCFGVFTLTIVTIQKWTCLRVFNRRWRDLITTEDNLKCKQLVKNDITITAEDHNKIISMINKYTKELFQLKNIIFFIYIFATSMYFVVPLGEYVVKTFILGRKEKLPQVFNLWSPFPQDVHYGYVLTVMIQTIGLWYCSFIVLAFDVIAIGTMIMISGQFSILQFLCERIAGDAVLQSPILNSSIKEQEKWDALAHRRIKECHEHHIILVKLVIDYLYKKNCTFFLSMSYNKIYMIKPKFRYRRLCSKTNQQKLVRTFFFCESIA